MFVSFQMAPADNFCTMFVQNRETNIKYHSKDITKHKKLPMGSSPFGNVPENGQYRG